MEDNTQENTAPSGEDLYQEAITEAPEETTEPVVLEGDTLPEQPKRGNPYKDEATGRFTSKPSEEPVEEPVREEKQDHRIPLAELMKERDARQAAQRDLDQLRQHMWQLQSQMQQAQQPKEEPVDIFANPEAYQQRIESTMSQRLRAMEGNFSLRLAANKHGDVFHEAWQEMVGRTQSGDDSFRQQVLNSPDPGETLVQLYQREKVTKEVGNDPTAYVNKKLEEALNDPKFLAKAIERAKAAAGTQSSQRIELPPSLNKVPGAATYEDNDMSGAALYNFAKR